jgi:hypothetical protein
MNTYAGWCPRGRGGRRADEGRWTVGARQSLCGMNQAAGGSGWGLGTVLGFGAGAGISGG